MPLDVNEFEMSFEDGYDIMKYINSKFEYLPPTANGVIRQNQHTAQVALTGRTTYMQNSLGQDIGPSKRPNP